VLWIQKYATTQRQLPGLKSYETRIENGDASSVRNGSCMKEGKRSNGKELRPEYKRQDFPRGLVRGKHASRVRASSNVVRLDPETASAFPTSEAVNEALSTFLKAAKNARVSKGR
jgi:hypothetical protein